MSQTVIYELAVLYRPDLEDKIDEVSQKFQKLIKDSGGQIIREDNWGRRQLAYEIAKQMHAIYIFYDIELPPASIAQLEESFNIADEILRYQFYKPDLKALKIALDNPQAQLQLATTDKGQSDESDETETGEGENVS